MRLTRRKLLGAVAGTAALAGCTGGPGGAASTETTDGESGPTVEVRSHPEHGEIPSGRRG